MIVILLRYLYLFKKLHNCSLRYTSILIFVLCIKFTFMASFHGECFSTASLSISEDGGMVALDDLVDESVDAKSSVNIRLHVIGREDLIEVVDLASVDLRLVNSLRLVLVGLHDFNLIATSYTQLSALKVLSLFMRQDRPNSHSNLNSLARRSKARLLFLGTEAE